MVDILIPTFNGAKYLDAQLQSIFNQDYKFWRIILRDDGSSDNTREIIAYWKNIYPEQIQELTDGKKGLGVSQSYGYLISKSEAPYIMLCDQDDYWHPQKISKSLQAIQTAEKEFGKSLAIMVCSDLEIVDSDLKLVSPSFWKDRNDDPRLLNDFEKLIAHSVVTGNTIMLNKSAAILVIPVKTNFFLFDQWISIKVARYGKIIFIDEPLVKYRQHSSNVLGSFRMSKTYLFHKVKFFPFYIRSWIKLKKELDMDFSVGKVLGFKILYNLRKAINA
ncbi:glycosyltransferase family 2 protein [uncultured Algoriphagus sp.]|uniref:glycosyltransferase family 2 protein n=1 Tax=uncultured Algoriphagus sp. TaxID=417365 RepID=UPI0030EB5271|tara:strand:- start:19769 stop:20596 length:828 start_codon:yes stop_codon:yes gene_type:complete